MENKDLLVSSSFDDENHQHNKELLTDINKEIWEPKRECCIYRVPKLIREINAEAYTPQVISIGPLHYGKSELASMEKHKKRYARSFYERIDSEKWKSLETFVKDNKETILNFYEDTIELRSHEFEQMVLLDAIFIIEFLIRYLSGDDRDVLQQRRYLNAMILMDFVLLENQLPYFLLEELYMIAFRDSTDFLPFHILCSPPAFFCPNSKGYINLERPYIKHFTDLLRHVWLLFLIPSDKQPVRCLGNLPTATKLHESGWKLKSITGWTSPFHIDFVKKKRLIPLFDVGELHMPGLMTQDSTEIFIRNVMALEQCHYPNDTHFCNYIHILDKLIDTKEDVELLTEKGILLSDLGDHDTTAKMINKLTKNIWVSESYLIDIVQCLNTHHKNPWNRAKATLVNVYFSNPWRGTATIAAVILLLLTLVQTICSILQVI